MARQDLLELTQEALMALSNAGFVKRAIKDIAEGRIPEVREEEDGCVEAIFSDGQKTRFPIGKTLKEASCSCPSSGMCRHRVMLVLAYQAQIQQPSEAVSPAKPGDVKDAVTDAEWSPAIFVPLLQDVPKSVIAQAQKQRENGVVVQLYKQGVSGETVPFARLPMCDVRFFSQHNLGLARCDCIQEQICPHIVLAIWGFEQAETQQPGFDQITLQLNAGEQNGENSLSLFSQPEAQVLLDVVQRLLLQIWLEGSTQAENRLTPLLAEAQHYADKLGWCWVSENISEVRLKIAEQQRRSSRFSPSQLLQFVTALPARLDAARYADSLSLKEELPPLPASQILGVGVKGEVGLEHLKLISLGAKYWSDDEQQGVSIAYADPASMAIMVLERQWPLTSKEEIDIGSRRIAGYSVHKLATCQVVTNKARRRANGALELTTGTRNSSLLPLSATAWQQLGFPVKHPNAASLITYLREQNPYFVTPRTLLENLFVLPVENVSYDSWDAARQCMQYGICSEAGREELDVILELTFDMAAPSAIDVFVEMMESLKVAPGGMVAGIARLQAGKLFVEPMAVANRLLCRVLHADQAETAHVEALGYITDNGDVIQLLKESEQLLLQWLQQGLRHQSPLQQERGKRLSEQLLQAGMSALSRRFSMVHAMSCSADKTNMTDCITQLAQLLFWLKSRACNE